MQIKIEGPALQKPEHRILAIEAAMRAICLKAGEDAADGVMALLTAAAHIARQNSDMQPHEILALLREICSHAVDASEGMFPREPAEALGTPALMGRERHSNEQ